MKLGKEDTLVILLSAWDRSRDSKAKRNLSKHMWRTYGSKVKIQSEIKPPLPLFCSQVEKHKLYKRMFCVLLSYVLPFFISKEWQGFWKGTFVCYYWKIDLFSAILRIVKFMLLLCFSTIVQLLHLLLTQPHTALFLQICFMGK